jgi:type VI secretion system Hcp family effector
MSLILVNISGVPGEANTSGFENQIECLAVRYALDNKVVVAATRTEGVSRHGPIELSHRLDKATPWLKLNASKGTNMGTVEISRVRTIGTQPRAVEALTLTNTFVVRVDLDTPVDPATGEPGEPLETFALEYDAITWAYTPYVNGVSEGVTSANYNVSTGVTA